MDQWVLWMWVGGLWPVGRWWWVVDLWVVVVCWCDCRGVIVAVVCHGVIVVVCHGVIVAVVWWFAYFVSEKREMNKKREKKIEMMMLYMMNILL